MGRRMIIKPKVILMIWRLNKVIIACQVVKKNSEYKEPENSRVQE